MTSQPGALLLVDLGVTRSHSRPQVSHDNPFSEAQFKTLKYRPDFPARFGRLEDARVCCQACLTWYNDEHCHAGIGLMTPTAVHDGRASTVRDARQRVLRAASAAHPERFVRKPPQPPRLPHAVWSNPPEGSIGLAGSRRCHDLDRRRPTGCPKSSAALGFIRSRDRLASRDHDADR